MTSPPSNSNELSNGEDSMPMPMPMPMSQQQYTYFATCIPGLSQVLAYEISTILPHLPSTNIQIQGSSGVSFDTSSPKDGLKALYWLRSAHRILQLICTNDPMHPHNLVVEEADFEDDSYKNPIIDRHDLYDYIRHSCNVPSLLGNGKGGILNLSCKCLSSSSSNLPQDLRHLHYTALTVKNALVDECRDLHPDNIRPDVNTVDPDVPFFLAIQSSGKTKHSGGGGGGGGVIVSLYRSLNGKTSLHKRGYRTNDVVHKAAMKESLASGLLYASGYDKLIQSTKNGDGKAVLLDPMMGSATLLMEAAYMASDVAPGLLREKFMAMDAVDMDVTCPPVLRWKGTDMKMWKEIREEAMERAKKGRQWLLSSCESKDIVIMGNEIHPRAHDLSQRYLSKGGLDKIISIYNLDCKDWKDIQSLIVEGRSMVVTNPPWGLRLQQNGDNQNQHQHQHQHHFNENEDEDSDSNYVVNSWNALEQFLKRECSGVEAWILSGNKHLTKLLKMKKSRAIPIHTGEEDLRWIQYHIFDWKRDGSFGDKGTSAKIESARMERAKM